MHRRRGPGPQGSGRRRRGFGGPSKRWSGVRKLPLRPEPSLLTLTVGQWVDARVRGVHEKVADGLPADVPFPEAGTSYIPVCIPAFRPDRCVREEASCCSGVAKRLAALHTKVEDAPEVLYHMVCFQCLSF